jgi:PAS domain S-box-containing protein
LLGDMKGSAEESGTPGIASGAIEQTPATAPDHLIRAAAAVVALSEIGLLFIAPGEVSQAQRGWIIAIQSVNAILAGFLFWSTFTRWFSEHWRALTLAACSALIANTLLASLFTRNVEWLVLTLVSVLIGASALAPWTPVWQSALSIVALGALASCSWRIEIIPIHWFEVAVAIALGEITTRFGMSYRRDLALQMAALRATQSRLLAEADERADAQHRARTSEQTIEKIFQAIPAAVLVTRMSDGAVLQCNQGIATFGYNRATIERLDGMLDRIWLHPDERQRYAAELRRRGSVQNLEVELRRSDGRPVPTLLSGVLAEIDGTPCSVTIARDVTDLKRAEQRFRERAEMFRKVFDRTSDAISINRLRDGACVEVNRALLEATGLRREDVVGRSDLELGFWLSLEQRAEFVQRLRREGSIRDVETELRAHSGRTVIALMSAALITVGGESCVAVFVHDITAAKAIERELRRARAELSHQVEALESSRHRLAESEATLRRIFDANLDAVAINDMETGVYLEVNEEFLRCTGFKREDVIGCSFDRVKLSQDTSLRRRFVRELRTNGSVRNMEADYDLKGGKRIHCLVSGIILELGGKQCCMSLARDVTELKETERQLVAAREAALESSRAKSEFLSSMSHEIRTPMNSILGMTDLLAETAMSDDQRHFVESIVTNGNALLELINGILDLARVESGRLTLEQGNFDLREAVETAATTLAIAAHAKNLDLTVRLAPGIPTALVGDAMRLRQVLVNLIGNAIKFTESGEISVEVDSVRDAPGRLQFSVRDTGIGIPADKVADLFGAFTQADSSTTRRYGGSGLGLAIVHRLVELMGGKIEVRSTPGMGSTFKFDAQFGLQRDGAAPGEQRPDLTNTPVLLVDDVATARDAVAEMLAECGARVTEASSGEGAVTIAREAVEAGAPFKLALIDSRMPGLGGYETAKTLIQMGLAQHAIVMMLCTKDLMTKVVKLKKLGLHRWVAKPIRRAELFDALSRTLENDSQPRAPVELPDHRDGAGPDSSAAASSAPAADCLRIMLADDSIDNRMLIRAYLRKTPWQLDEARNGREAIEMFKRQHYDVVLMDIQMPEVDGYEATRAIRRLEHDRALPHTPVLALTASALGDAAERSFAAGCDAHITKPVKKAALLSMIRDATQPRRGRAAEPESCPAEER